MKRIEYIDHARAFGMFLVFYAHFVEKLFDSGVMPAFDQWRFVCSFLMQFFFFLAGVFWKPVPFSREFFFEKMRTRLVPSIFFSLLLFPLWIGLGSPGFLKYLAKGDYLWGKPLNYMMWFVICLMMVEFLAALIARYLKVDPFRMAIYALASFGFGYYILVNQHDRVLAMTGIDPNLWYLDDAFIVLSFYIFGCLSKSMLVKLSEARGWLISLVVAPVSAFLLWSAFTTHPDENLVVLISLSLYGHIGYFFATSFAGIIFLLAVSRLFSVKIPLIRFIGQNTLILLGLNGVCFHFLDAQVVNSLKFLPATSFAVFTYTSIYVLAVLLLFSPLVWGIRRWLPELTGYEWSPTSLLPPMREWEKVRFLASIRAWLQKYLLRSDV